MIVVTAVTTREISTSPYMVTAYPGTSGQKRTVITHKFSRWKRRALIGSNAMILCFDSGELVG